MLRDAPLDTTSQHTGICLSVESCRNDKLRSGDVIQDSVKGAIVMVKIPETEITQMVQTPKFEKGIPSEILLN